MYNDCFVLCPISYSYRKPNSSQNIRHGTYQDTFRNPPRIKRIKHIDKRQIGKHTHQQHLIEQRTILKLQSLQRIPQIHRINIQQAEDCREKQSKDYSNPVFIKAF